MLKELLLFFIIAAAGLFINVVVASLSRKSESLQRPGRILERLLPLLLLDYGISAAINSWSSKGDRNNKKPIRFGRRNKNAPFFVA